VGDFLAFLRAQLVFEPLHVGFVAGEGLDEVGARHTATLDRQRHDFPFVLAYDIQRAADIAQQLVVNARYQLEQREVLGHGLHRLAGAGVVAAILLQCLLGFVEQRAQMVEALGGEYRVKRAVIFIIIGVVRIIGVVFALGFFFLGFFCLGLGAFCKGRLTIAGGGGSAVIVRVEVAGNDVGQAPLFEGDLVEFTNDKIYRTWPERNRMQHFTNAFLDALGDFDFAFAGQQFDGAHFAHVHAHRVGGAARFGFNRRKYRCRFFRRHFVSVVGVVGHQQLGIGGFFDHRDAHVVDHLDDVFHLVGVGNRIRQVVVHFGIGQVALFLAKCDQQF